MIKNFVEWFRPGRSLWLIVGLSLGLGLLLGFRGQATPTWSGHNQAAHAVLTLIEPESICLPGHPAAATGFFMLLTVGLLTGLSHCVGMCGPLVSTFALRRRAAGQEVATPLGLFQLGRLTTYVSLGLLLGGFGSLANLGAILAGWQGTLTILFGLLVVVMGLNLSGWLPLRRLFESMALARRIAHLLQTLFASRHPLAPFGLGLANGLLPCGAVYSMSLLAAVSGNPWQGGLIMLLFGLGTLLPLVAVGFSVSMLSIRLRQGLFRAAAMLVILAGTQLILRGLAAGGLLPHTAIGAVMLW